MAPYHYEDVNMVRAPGGPRRPNGDERARLLGFNSGHFPRLSEDQKGQLTGNAFPVVIVARDLAGLVTTQTHCNVTQQIWSTWVALEKRAQLAKSHTWEAQFGKDSGIALPIPTFFECL